MISSGTQIGRLELLASWTQLLRNTPKVSGQDGFSNLKTAVGFYLDSQNSPYFGFTKKAELLAIQ